MVYAGELPPHPFSFEERYRKDVRLVMYWTRCHGISADEAEDLAQEVFLALHLAHVQWRFDGANPRGWLRMATYRITRDYLAYLARNVSPLRIETDAAEVKDRTDEGAEQNTSMYEDLESVSCLLKCLPEERQRLLVLHYLEEKTASEIAETLNIPRNTVHSRLQRARKDWKAACARLRASERHQKCRTRAILPPLRRFTRRAPPVSADITIGEESQ